MGGIALTISKNLLNAQFGAVALSPPANFYVAIFSTVPTDITGAGGVEFTADSYERPIVANDATQWPAATGSPIALKANANVILFPTALEAWGTGRGFGLYDALTGGNLHAIGKIDAAINVILGMRPQVDAGQFKITIEGKP